MNVLSLTVTSPDPLKIAPPSPVARFFENVVPSTRHRAGAVVRDRRAGAPAAGAVVDDPRVRSR